MLKKLTGLFLFTMLVASLVCHAQEKASSNLILRVDANISGPFGGQKSSSCLRVYSDGKVLYAHWWNSFASVVDEKTGEKSRPENMVSLEHHLGDGDKWELSSFLESKVLKNLPEKFGPPRQPIDYFESVTVQIIAPDGKKKNISTREFYVAGLEEKSHYPSALIVLMDKIDEIEREANEKGKPASPPTDCQLKPEHP
jgi:hypothetical protein